MAVAAVQSIEQRIRYRLIGARYELAQAARDSQDTGLSPRWRQEVELAELAATRALALMEEQK